MVLAKGFRRRGNERLVKGYKVSVMQDELLLES
jgi:hypothetical protein